MAPILSDDSEDERALPFLIVSTRMERTTTKTAQFLLRSAIKGVSRRRSNGPRCRQGDISQHDADVVLLRGEAKGQHGTRRGDGVVRSGVLRYFMSDNTLSRSIDDLEGSCTETKTGHWCQALLVAVHQES